MRASDHDTMYADTFISYLDRKFNIHLISFDDDSNEIELICGNKYEVLDYLEDEADRRYVLCDTSCMYVYGIECTIYVE